MKSLRFSVPAFFAIFVFVSCYIIPNYNLFGYSLSKMVFLGASLLFYILNFKKMKKKELVFAGVLIVMTFLLKNTNYMLFIYLPIGKRVIEQKAKVKEFLLSSNILYICLFATIVYSISYFGTQGRYAFSAIKEINQSGLAIFILGYMLLYKKKGIGIIVLAFGLLTFSRSYYLAIAVLLIGKFIKLNRLKQTFIKKFNYLNITIASSITLFLTGVFYIVQYKAGNITLSPDKFSRVFNFLDYSNLFRFSAIVLIVSIFKNNPKLLLTGMENSYYIRQSYYYANKIGIPYAKNIPHNLFFSHLKMYGIMAVIEIVYVSAILKEIVNRNNFLFYIAIILYSILLGSGLFNYWLFLTIYALIISDGEKVE